MSSLRQIAGQFRRTPLHPQWLLGRRRVPKGIAGVSGMILDVGAADRWIERELSAGTEYVSIDYPPTGRDMYGGRPHVFADAGDLPFDDATFDGAVCLEVLEHVRDPARVISEIARVIKPGGRAWLSTPFLYPLHDVPFDFQRYTEYGLKRDIERSGMTIVSLQRTTNAICTAGVLACLAIAGGVQAKRHTLRPVWLPFALLMVTAINLLAWLLGSLWPEWVHMTSGYQIEVRKP